MTAMPTIALVDDDRTILTTLALSLEAEGFTVETYTEGQSALEGFVRRMPDMALLGIRMHRMDGIELLRRLREKSLMPVILLTSRDDEIDEITGLRLGADDYVTKPFSLRLLVERIRALLRRQDLLRGGTDTAPDEGRILRRGDLTMDAARHTVTWKGREVSLTLTEFLLLQALAQRPGFVRSRDRLMAVAHGDRIHAEDRAIDSHIKRLRAKLRAIDDSFSAIETLYGIGYRYTGV
jgi:two-component system response regulator ChvI